jgi:hypothetical protein
MTGGRRVLVPTVAAAWAGLLTAALLVPAGPPARPAVAVSQPVSRATLVCPPAGPTGPTDRQVTVVPGGPGPLSVGTLLGQPVPTTPDRGGGLAATPAGPHPVVVRASGPAATGLSAAVTEYGSAGFGEAEVACAPPATDWWFVGASGALGRNDRLDLTNPAPQPAVVNVSVLTTAGGSGPAGAQGLVVPARGTVNRTLTQLAPDAPTVALHVVAVAGAVDAAVWDAWANAAGQPAGADWLPATTPGRVDVLPGLPGGSGRQLVVADPGPVDATIDVTALTPAGPFRPAGLSPVVIPAGSVRLLSLPVLSTQPAALVVHADHPVVAAALAVDAVGVAPDVAWTAGTPALAGPAAVPLSAFLPTRQARLLLCAPDRAATVQITVGGVVRMVTVPAGRTVRVVPANLLSAAKEQVLTVRPMPGSGPAYVSRVLTDTSPGGALLSLLDLLSPARSVLVPPVSPDPDAALPPP